MELRRISSGEKHQGFTLIELLAVMVIIGLLLAIAGAGLQSALGSHKLSTAVGTFRNDLGWAAVEATKDNRPVHLRLYKYQPEDGVYEEPYFLAYQFLTVDSKNATMLPLTEVRKYSDGVIVHPNVEYSSVLSLEERSPVLSSDDGGITDPDLRLPPPYTFVEFLLKPDGSTDLPKDGKWSVAFVESTSVLGDRESLPADHRVLVINPFTASTRAY